jgi:NADH dehydrogenase FAD-containing subunit
MSAPVRLVVVGGGFGGLEAVLELERRFRDGPAVGITLVSENRYNGSPLQAEGS